MRNLDKYKGVIPAFYACYDEKGEISPAGVQRLAQYFIDKGVKGVYVNGSSGECIYQSVEDKKIVLENVMKVAKGKLTVIAHVACNNTKDSMELARHANACMDILREGIAKLGYRFLCDSPSNQLFPIFPQNIREKIDEKYLVMDNSDEGNGYHSVRMVTSWATDPQQCKAFVEDLAAWSK